MKEKKKINQCEDIFENIVGEIIEMNLELWREQVSF